MDGYPKKEQPSANIEAAMKAYLNAKNESTLDKLVSSGTGLVHYFAKIYAPGQSKEDLIQAGYEGLIKAAERYDRNRGVSFSTYAGHYIMGEMRHLIRREAAFDRPAWVADLQNKVNCVIEKHMQINGEPPSIAQIANELNVREEGVVQAMRAGWVSIEEIDISQIHSQRYASFTLPIEDRIALKIAMEKLSKMQRKVIEALFYQGMTQTETAEALGVNQRKVSRLLKRSLEILARFFS
ncbi:RNA polymerase sigma-B factor [Desulfotomaculum arcticum]|uniref:RNA polymerase sigma-B factor n=1 Tax=Desulfotruncus arcticus DSM 17038 TaxID=1121424 RepID=A0A1I2MTR9_9FIRM|nr:sigma-70 family RNA polymerase sigma factor [Desulfotruncus arcticus]SFF92746.1 RNA polymerase sigma-B factor [Desulfotomaculum arcticum] [Desulfotruncus arcticus DSM 17038]